MMSMLVEAVVVSFCFGGAIGALVAMQLKGNVKRSEARVVQQQRYSK